MTFTEQIANQLQDELQVIFDSLVPFVGTEPTFTPLRIDVVAAELATGNDDVAAEATTSIMLALWPSAAPEECGNAEWWVTPLGRACARSLGNDDAEAVSYGVAASMLTVSRGSISSYVARGSLDRHPDGGVVRASVMQRLARGIDR